MLYSKETIDLVKCLCECISDENLVKSDSLKNFLQTIGISPSDIDIGIIAQKLKILKISDKNISDMVQSLRQVIRREKMSKNPPRNFNERDRTPEETEGFQAAAKFIRECENVGDTEAMWKQAYELVDEIEKTCSDEEIRQVIKDIENMNKEAK